MAANTKKTIKIEEVRAEQLKKAIKEIETLSDPYQKVKSRLMLVQAINGIGQVSVEDIPEGREALETNKKKTSNKSSNKAKETVEKAKEAVQQVEQNYSEANTEAAQEVQEEVTPNVTEAPEPEVQPAQTEEVTGPVLIQLDTEEGVVEYDVTDSYLKLTEVPDDENKQLLAYYLMAYDADSVAAITEAFSNQITADPYELLNADNYVAFLDYFNACLQG